MRIRILDPNWKKWIKIRIRIKVISLRFTEFFNKAGFSNFLSLYVLLIFMLKFDEPFRNQECLQAKILRIEWIQILSTGNKFRAFYDLLKKHMLEVRNDLM